MESEALMAAFVHANYLGTDMSLLDIQRKSNIIGLLIAKFVFCSLYFVPIAK